MNSFSLRRITFLVCILQSILFPVYSQSGSELWIDVSENTSFRIGERSGIPDTYRSLKLDLPSMKTILNGAIDEFLSNAYTSGPIIVLPMPDGSFPRFRVALTTAMHEDLAAKFPMIHTFTARGIDDKSAVAKIDYTQWGFHAMIMSPNGWVFIDPASQSNTTDYICYDRVNAHPASAFFCGTESSDFQNRSNPLSDNSLYRSSGTQLKTYRLAMACTGEYATFHGGTPAGALSAMVTTVNRVNGVYELELAVRMVLIANNNLLVYTNGATDPYTNGSGSTMLTENISNVNTVIGLANYDFGHVVSTGGGGVAYLGVICSSTLKAGGVTGSGAPVGDNFDIDYVAHEMGHQFGGSHTFNSVTGSCNGNRSATNAYEPGSGTTIMAYAGICGADNIQPHSDAIFHTRSFDQIQDHITTGGGNTCFVGTSTNNFPPVVTVGANYSIPLSTPFILTGSATDANGDAISYLWEQYDTGPSGTPNSPTGNAPIFRDFTPATNPFRVFPRMQDLVRNTQTLGEILPSYARSLKFRLTARDNRSGGGGVTYNDTPVTLTVVNTTTPFKVTAPNTAVNWFNNTVQTVTWDVSSTNIAPISCASVNILLSLDSGYTYPYALISNTPNDGSEIVPIPNVTGNKARIKVESVGNIFFDISNVNFTISAASPILTTISTSPLSSNSLCAGASVNVEFTTDGPANSGNKFTALLSNSSGSFSNPDSIGSLISTASGTINATIPAGVIAGSGYRIRVISSDPAITGSDNGTNIAIFQLVGTPGLINGSSVVCQGQTGVVFSVPTISNATGYIWTLPSGATIIAGSNTNLIAVNFSAVASSGSVVVQGTNAGCGNGPASVPFPVTVNPLPGAAGIISGSGTVCQNTTGVTYSVASVSNATGYLWSLPSGASVTSGANTNSISVSFSPTASSGIITVRATNACGNGAISPSFNVTVIPAPVAPVITPSGTVTICSPGSVVLSFISSPGVAYQWRKNGIDIAGETGTSYTASTLGNYDVVARFAGTGSQSFSNNNRSFIPDATCTGGTSVITVSGYNSIVNTTGISITMNITHTWVGDLVVMMQTPDGSWLGLSNRTGNSSNSSNNFTNTVFSDAGSIQISGGVAPYTGIFQPVSTTFTDCFGPTLTSFSAIGSGSVNPNGNWTLGVFDRAGSDTGSIQNWSISFPASIPNTCTSISNALTVNVNGNPSINSFSPPGGGEGTPVTINGSGFTGVSSVNFNGTPSAFTFINDNQLTTTVPVGATNGLITVTTLCGSSGSGIDFTVIDSVILNVRVLIEGFYSGTGKMKGILSAVNCDTIETSLAASLSPYLLSFSKKGVIDTSGNGEFTFPGAAYGHSYYVVIRHRNSLETWSSLPMVLSSAVNSYNFTTASSQAYGNNLKSQDGFFAMISGDVNQDDNIDSLDIYSIEFNSEMFLTGYFPFDLTGDGLVESVDYSLVENNLSKVLLRP